MCFLSARIRLFRTFQMAGVTPRGTSCVWLLSRSMMTSRLHNYSGEATSFLCLAEESCVFIIHWRSHFLAIRNDAATITCVK